MTDSRLRALDEQEANEFLAMAGDSIRDLVDRYIVEVSEDLANDTVAFARYMKFREGGVAHVWALMAACRQASGSSGTDRAFDEHARQRMMNMPKWQQENYLKRAKEAGIATQGKFHVGGLGAPDDPRAWVSDTHDIRRQCKERNLSCEGHIKIQGTPVPPRRVDLAPDLVEEMVQHECEADPSLAAKVRKDGKAMDGLRHLVREKYGPKKASC